MGSEDPLEILHGPAFSCCVVSIVWCENAAYDQEGGRWHLPGVVSLK
jgi:hypothetical protein